LVSWTVVAVVLQVGGQGVIAAGEAGVQFIADGIGVRVGGRGIGIPG